MIAPAGFRGAGVPLEPCGFADLPGFGAAECAAAFPLLHAVARAEADGASALRPARSEPDALRTAFAAALALGPSPTPAQALAFIEARFSPWRVAAEAFFTGYYEPVLEGSLAPGPGFAAPLLRRPDDLVTFAAEDTRPAGLAELSAAQRLPDGTLAPYPERAAIMEAAAAGRFTPLAWVRDEAEAFFIHVQGSARLRLPDGRTLRVTYAGRNGQPYTGIGRVLVERGVMTAPEATMAALKQWIRAAGQAHGEAGRSLMALNRSYIFFDGRLDEAESGPIGGAGLPLTAGRSIAVDRGLWSYGLPFFVETAVPDAAGAPRLLQRLTVAQDTGSAIVGPARVDLFLGSGEAAGEVAGALRARGRLTVLLPR